MLRRRIQEVYHQHVALLQCASLDEWEKAAFLAVLDGNADEAAFRNSLLTLTRILHRAHGERVVVLIDEYDAPIHAGWAYGYYREIVDFFRTFFESGLKDNPHLYQSVLTGILRVAKESIFSGLNNAQVPRGELNLAFRGDGQGGAEDGEERLGELGGCTLPRSAGLGSPPPDVVR
jgi:hypothetical protein